MKDLKKIHICGIYGSGKSTLAKNISKKLKLPYFSLTDVKYRKKYSKTRSEEKMRSIVKDLAKKKKWVTEECWGERAEPLFKEADLIILMLIPKTTCQYRILKRFLTRKKEEKDTLISALKMCKKVSGYYKTKEPVSLHSHLALIKKYKRKVLKIKNSRDIITLMKQLK